MQSADEITQGQWQQQDCDRAALVWYIMLQINFIYLKKKKKKKKKKKNPIYTWPDTTCYE
jgi:hypothetical protein